MAKVTYTKLGLKPDTETKIVTINNQEIEVKQYLPSNTKLELIGKVLMDSYDPQNNFANPLKVDIFMTIYFVEYYTNITFTDKQKESADKLYDALISSGAFEIIKYSISLEEYNAFYTYLWKTIDAYYKYKDSVFGILEAINTDYNDLDMDITKLQEKISNPENLTLLKDVLTKLD